MKNAFLKKAFIIIFTVVVIPSVFFLVFELVLRIAGYGFPTDFFVKENIMGTEYYVNNYKFSWQFFPKPMARLSASVVVPLEKDENAVRIFVLGESAAMGDPEPAFSFSRHLQAMLEKKYPGKKIEIYNTAVTAINSNVIVPIVHDCLKLKPDLFIVYMGNNEVIGPFGLSAALTPFFSSLWVIRMQVWLGQTRVGQLFREWSADKKINDQEWHGMELFMKNKVRNSSPDLQTIYNHYENNIHAICEMASAVGAKVVLTTIITNERDSAPFLSLHKDGITALELRLWEQYYNSGKAQEVLGNYKAALSDYEKAHLIDKEYAELIFRMAKCYLLENNSAKAAAFFSMARDYDALRFRCDSHMNEIIRSVAQENNSNNIFLADADKFIRKQCIAGIPGNDLLYEHVHLNFKGNYLLAQSILDQTEKALALSDSSSEQINQKSNQERLVYTRFDEKRIDDINLVRIQSVPFRNQYTNPVEIKALESKLENINKSLDSAAIRTIRSQYQHTVAVYPRDWFLHLDYLRFLFNFEYYAEAAKEAEKLYELLSYEYLSSVNMGITRKVLKKYPEAESYFKQAIDRNPYFSEAYKNMALLFEEEGKFNQVEYYLMKGRCSTQEFMDYYNRTGIKFAKNNLADDAILYFRKAVELNPVDNSSRANLQHALDLKNQVVKVSPEFSEAYNKGNTLFKQQNFKEAIEYYKLAIKLNPSFPKAHNNMAIAFIQLKNYDEAIQHFSQAIAIDPSFMEVYPNLGMLLESQQRFAEAVDVLKRGLKVKPSRDLYHILADVYVKMGDQQSANKCAEEEKKIN